MGKKRNQRRRNRREKKDNLVQRFQSQSLLRTIEQEVAIEEFKAAHKEYSRKMTALEDDIMSRTVFVSNVLDLRIPSNLKELERFLQQTYGQVEFCKIAEEKRKRSSLLSTKSFPRGRVCFRRAEDARMIFDGVSLSEAQRQNLQERIPCATVGFKGYIWVRPTHKFNNMVPEHLAGSKTVSIPSEGLCLGHWFPQDEKDAFLDRPGRLEDDSFTRGNVWVQEHLTDAEPILHIDFATRVVEMEFPLASNRRANGGLDSFLGMLFQTLADDDAFTNVRTVASFRFKDFAHPMELHRCRESGKMFLIFTLKHPPKLTTTKYNYLVARETKTRLTKVADIDGNVFGSCLGYRLEVTDTTMEHLLINGEAMGKLHSFGIIRSQLDSLQQALPFDNVLHIPGQRIQLETKMSQLGNTRIGLLMRSIIDNQSWYWFDILTDKVDEKDLFNLISRERPSAVENVLALISNNMHEKTRYPAQMFNWLFQAEQEGEIHPLSVPDFCFELPRVLITPCHQKVTGYQVEMSNRMVRKFVNEYNFSPEAFVRVNVGDENGDVLYSDDLDEDGPVDRRIFDLLCSGILVNGNHYQFLAYSSSQLKELSLWMVCPEHGWSAMEMRGSMGDFSTCTTPWKYAARMGQCFSTTVEVSKVNAGFYPSNRSSGKFRVNDSLPDIASGDPVTGKEFVHSDGAGLIRRELLLELLLQFPSAPKDPRNVSAIQIRYGGAKGVLTAWDFDELQHLGCRGFDVCLRPSMVKFKAPYDRIEIISIGKHVPYYLNRNVILLACEQGVPRQTILAMQEEMLESLNLMLTDPHFALAFIPGLSGPDSNLTSTLTHMLFAGLKPNSDPFLFSCLYAIRNHHLMNLRKKARIHVKKAAVLIGSIDETGTIPEGCVFLQVRKEKADDSNFSHFDEFEPVLGPVMVTKHPVMHPGDLRMLLGVDVPRLRGHKNVLLFSQIGKRPEADKMSGSDLDGDEFAVTWDERLFLKEQCDPMDYSPPKAPDKTMDTSESSQIRHFINHARTANLGHIAMLWLDHASKERSAKCDQCLKLAELHSVAVDFPKSGVPAVIPDSLKIHRTTPRAHWREKKGSPTFHCESILGELYDQVIKESEGDTTVSQRQYPAKAGRSFSKRGQLLRFGNPRHLWEAKDGLYDPTIPQRLGLSIEKDQLLLAFAKDQRLQYESQLLELMNKYRITSEGEIVTGCLLKYHKLNKRRRHGISEQIRQQFRNIRVEFRTEFFRAVNRLVVGDKDYFYFTAIVDVNDDPANLAGDNSHASERAEEGKFERQEDEDEFAWIEEALTKTHVIAGGEAMHQLASFWAKKLAAAYYMASYSPEMHMAGSEFVLYSFPWVVADVIRHGSE